MWPAPMNPIVFMSVFLDAAGRALCMPTERRYLAAAIASSASATHHDCDNPLIGARLASFARLGLECRIGRKLFEMCALHERLAEIVGVDDLRDDRQPHIAIWRRHAVVVLGHRR